VLVCALAVQNSISGTPLDIASITVWIYSMDLVDKTV